MDKFTGRVWVLGDDIDTDIIIPTEYLALKTINDMKQYGFSPLRPELAGQIQKGDIIVAGKNFGCGSSREQAPEIIKARLADCDQIKYLASRYMNTQSCFFIGRGFDYSLSLEGSLKLKEISYVHSDAYAAGELKHGTISLITDGVPVIALATQKQVYEKTISNAKETRSRGARVLLFTTKDAVVPEGVADAVIRLDEYEDILMPLQLIVPLQLFAYYMAVLRGCDVDKPRNLAKSVTVE